MGIFDFFKKKPTKEEVANQYKRDNALPDGRIEKGLWENGKSIGE